MCLSIISVVVIIAVKPTNFSPLTFKVESSTSLAEKIWPNTSKHLACLCTFPWAVCSSASWKHTASRCYRVPLSLTLNSPPWDFVPFACFVLCCCVHHVEEMRPVTAILNCWNYWSLGIPLLQSYFSVTARLPWGFLFPAGSAILLWYDPENANGSGPNENANGSGPKHWLENLLKFNV